MYLAETLAASLNHNRKIPQPIPETHPSVAATLLQSLEESKSIDKTFENPVIRNKCNSFVKVFESFWVNSAWKHDESGFINAENESAGKSLGACN